MGNIRLLDQYLIDRIAAGEVVQRPVNVVKELIENSIDANATAITVQIKDGGVKEIRVTDNGSGMAPDDAVLSFKRHATSKIKEFNDLNAIGTLGFRGEALSAISAVSHMEIATKSEKEDMGIKLILKGGVLHQKNYLGMADGTTILVKNLFFNTPARLKFLKAHGAEAAAVSDIVARFILAYPTIAIKYISNGKTVAQSFGDGVLLSAAAAIYGADIKQKTLNVNYKAEDITVKGLIGVPQYAFKNRKMQSLFINGRYVLSDQMTKIIAKAYDHWLVPGLFPFYVLSINMPLSETDVNIHPNKLEIKFKNEDRLATALTEAVEFTLSTINALPKVSFAKDNEPKPQTQQQVFSVINQTQKTLSSDNVILDNDIDKALDALFNDQHDQVKRVKAKQHLIEATPDVFEQDYTYSTNFNEAITTQDASKKIKTELKETINPEIRYIGTFHNTYLIVEVGTDLLLVDQHAAHERLIFDTLMDNYKNKTARSQILMLPEVIKVSDEEKNILYTNKKMLVDLGFAYQIKDDLNISFTAIPSDLTDLSIEMLLDDIYTSADNHHGMTAEIDAIIMKSCKKAVKAGRDLPFEEAKHLIELFIGSGHLPTCPHGRPIIIILSEKELEKYFRRTV